MEIIKLPDLPSSTQRRGEMSVLELYWLYEHTFPFAFRAPFQQIQCWQAGGIPGRSAEKSKQFLRQQASASGGMVRPNSQRHAAESK